METNPYSPPESNLESDNAITIRASFSTLNIWRKLYIVFTWTFHIFVAALLAITVTQSNKSNAPIMIGLSAYLLGVAYWNHWAIVTRNVSHITTLAVLNLIPSGNILGCLIMFSIRRVTVNERKRFNIVNA